MEDIQNWNKQLNKEPFNIPDYSNILESEYKNLEQEDFDFENTNNSKTNNLLLTVKNEEEEKKGNDTHFNNKEDEGIRR